MGKLARYEWYSIGRTGKARGMENAADGTAVRTPGAGAFGDRCGERKTRFNGLRAAKTGQERHSYAIMGG